MRATSGFQSSRQDSVRTVNKPTRLGSQKDCAKQGRYAKLYGDHWRSESREKLTFAAAGLLGDIWSYCADQATDRVSTTVMRKLCASDQKNAGRMLKQLVSAGYLAASTMGWDVLQWHHLNPIAKTYQLRAVDDAPARGSEEAETRPETLAQRNAAPEIIEEPCVPRARAETQDPRVKKQPPPTAGSEAAPPTRPAVPKKARPRDERKATFRRVLEQACAEAGVLAAGALMPSQLAAAAQKAGEHAAREGIDYETAALKLSRDAAEQVRDGRKSALCWALRDWQPNAAPPRPLYGRQKLEIAPCSPASEFDTVEEAERKIAEREAEVARIVAARKEMRRVGT